MYYPRLWNNRFNLLAQAGLASFYLLLYAGEPAYTPAPQSHCTYQSAGEQQLL